MSHTNPSGPRKRGKYGSSSSILQARPVFSMAGSHKRRAPRESSAGRSSLKRSRKKSPRRDERRNEKGIMLRRLVKTAAASALHWTGAARRLAGNSPLVLSYHRVVDDFSEHAQHSIPAMLTSTKMLERQLDWIGRRYQFVSLDELAAALQAHKQSPRPIVAVTFDD